MRTATEEQSIYCKSCRARGKLHRVRLQNHGSETAMYLCEDCIKYVADMMGGNTNGKENATADVT